MASLKAKAKAKTALATGANWQTKSAPPIIGVASDAPPFKASHPPKYKSLYAGMDLRGAGQMRHTTFHGRH